MSITSTATIDSQLAELLTDLSDTQHELLTLLGEKRSHLMTANLAALAKLQPREEAIVVRLKGCQDKRAALLQEADDTGLPHASIRDLAAALPSMQRKQMKTQLDDATARGRLLQHHSLANWVFVQRTLLHLSQMLEIIATGGRTRPTYGKGDSPESSGNLVDQEA
jgi:hypothetical protein